MKKLSDAQKAVVTANLKQRAERDPLVAVPPAMQLFLDRLEVPDFVVLETATTPHMIHVEPEGPHAGDYPYECMSRKIRPHWYWPTPEEETTLSEEEMRRRVQDSYADGWIQDVRRELDYYYENRQAHESRVLWSLYLPPHIRKPDPVLMKDFSCSAVCIITYGKRMLP